MKRIGRWLAGAAAWAGACTAAWGQWTTQDIALREGWNAVCVRVAPTEGSLAELERQAGEGTIEGVWRWDKRFTTAEYVVDEGSPLAKDPHWKAWYPGEEVGFLSTLGEVSGWRCYLVKVREGAGGRTVRLKGKVRLPRVAWHPNALNLVGFPVGEGGATFEEWFEADRAVDLSKGYDNGAWVIARDGSEHTVVKPGLQKLAAGEAVWVRCDGASAYTGPVEVRTDAGAGLDFGAGLQKIVLSVANLSATQARTLTLALRDSEEAPEGEEQVAGGVPLYLAEGDGWVAFEEKTVELGAGETWQGTFGVHRAEMEWSDGASSYQSVLGVRDAGKIAIDVPVRAVREAEEGAGGSGSIHEVEAESHGQAGLWIGEAVLTEVNCPNYQGEELLPVRHPARVKLILHVGGDGTARLLKEAWVAAATNGSGMAVYASRELVPNGTGEVWRASSATLPGMAPLALADGAGAAATNGLSGTLAGTVALAYDDPLNPFLHRYHPLFDNKDGQFQAYDGPVESRDVGREITLEVAEADETALEDAAVAVRGTYEERLTGLRAQEIVVKGTFRVEKAVGGAELVAGE